MIIKFLTDFEQFEFQTWAPLIDLQRWGQRIWCKKKLPINTWGASAAMWDPPGYKIQ